MSSDQQQPYPQDPYARDPYPQDPYTQHPYAPRQPYPAPQQPYPYGQDPTGQAYGGHGHPDPAYGAQGHQAQAHQDPAYGAQGAYDPQGAPQPQPGDGWRSGEQGVAQTWEGQTWDTQYQPTVRPGGPAPVPAPDAEQTAYLPPVPAPEAEQTAYLPPVPVPAVDAAETAYLPPVNAAEAPYPAPVPAAHAAGTASVPPVAPAHASGSYPLPPEVPAAPAAPAAPASASAADGYSAPTTLGNSRITDAQRARAEGRSPIIPPGTQPAAITAGLGLLLALGAALGPYALAVPLVLLQGLTAAGWFRLNGMWPARQGIALAFAGGLVADVALLAAGRDDGPAAILGTLGVWVLLTVVLQLRSHAGADERMQGLMATLASAALAVLAAGLLAAVPDAVTAGSVAVAAAVLVRALPLPGPASVVGSLAVAAAGGAVGGALAGLGGSGGALLGLAAGVCALVGLRVASYDYPSRFVHMTAGVALPLTAAVPAVYLVGRLLG
ncbi:hypothetical protein ACWCXC_23460 [Streptomyces sp. NPDC001515]